MRSTFAGFNTVVRGIFANQTGMDTAGHNVTNANTDGYSRQSVNLVTTDPQTIPSDHGSYQIGTGVTVASITRARDTLLDKQYWKETSTLSYNSNIQELLGKIENSFGDPSDTGIQSVLNKFWNSWQTLASNASDDGSRTSVRETGVALVNSIQASANQLKNMVDDINDVITKRVDTINQYTDEISQLNKKIFSVEAAGTDNANDLRDRRDYLCDELSSIIDIHVTEDKNGNYIVQTGGGYVLADSTSSTKLATTESRDADYGYIKQSVKIAGSSPEQIVQFKNGELKSLIDMRDSETGGIKGYLNDLSSMSQFLLQDFNEVHKSGYGTDNTTGNNFFGADGVNYDSTVQTAGYTKDKWITELCVSPALFANGGTAKIAAKSSGASIGVTQDRAEGSKCTVFASGKYTNGTTATDVQVKVNSLKSGTNDIQDIVYSIDGGQTFTTTPVTLDSNGHAALSINGLTVDVYLKSGATNQIGDKFKFSLNEHSADSNISVTTNDSTCGAGSVVSATGTYTNGDVATSVIVQPVTIDTATNASATPPTVIGKVRTVKYSTDGGVSWATATVDSSTASSTNSTFTFTNVSGVSLTMQIATDADNNTNNQYYFTVSKGNVASGDNAALLSKRLKNDTSTTLGGMSLDSYYSSVIGALGVQREDAIRAETNQQTLCDQINNQREAVSGVSLDEEMTNMIKFQKGYNAAARMMTTMDEMLDKLINSTGVVGR